VDLRSGLSASFVYSLHSGLALAMGSTRVMKHLHLWVISASILSHCFLATDVQVVCVVLVLDQSSICWPTISWGVYLVLDSIICFRGHVYPIIFMGRGSLVDW